MPLEHTRALATGTALLDCCVVESKLGEGGMGVVYLVRNITTGVAYAVKRSKFTDAKARDSFLAELQTWIDLPPHSHIVTCRFFRTHDEDITVFSDYCEVGHSRRGLQAVNCTLSLRSSISRSSLRGGFTPHISVA